MADAAADACAEISVVSVACLEAEKWSAIAYNIAVRLAVIEAEVREFCPKGEWVQTQGMPEMEALTEEERVQRLQFAIEAKRHELRREGNFVHCIRCRPRKSCLTMENEPKRNV